MALRLFRICTNRCSYDKVLNVFPSLHSYSSSKFIYQGQESTGLREFGTSSSRHEIFNVQDEDDFQEKVVKSDIPVIVDFHANWCGPCKLLGPRLEGIIGGKREKVHLAKIDIDSVSDLALEYGVTAVPSVLAFKEGKVVDKFIGLQDETRIDAFVNKLMGE